MRMMILGLCILLSFSCRAPLDEIELEPLLIESGDLPAGVSGSQVSASNQEFSGRGVPSPCNYISQDLAYQGEVIGGVSVLVFEEEQDAEAAYQTLREDYNSLQLMNDCSELIAEYRTAYWNEDLWKSGVCAFEAGTMDDVAYLDVISRGKFQTVSRSLHTVLYLGAIRESYTDFNNSNEYRAQYQEFLNNLSGVGVSLGTATDWRSYDTASGQMGARDAIAQAGFGTSYRQANQLQRDFIENYMQRQDNSGNWSGPQDEIVSNARQAALDAVGNVNFGASRYDDAIQRAIEHEGVTQSQFTTYAAYQVALSSGDEELAQSLRDQIGEGNFYDTQSAYMRYKGATGLIGDEAAGVAIVAPVFASIEQAAMEAGIESRGEAIYNYLISHEGSLHGFDLGDGADSNSALSRASRGNISTRSLVEELEISSMLEDYTIGETHEMDTHDLGDMAVSSIVEVTVNPLGLQSIEFLCKTGHAVFLVRAMSENGSFSKSEMLLYTGRLASRLEPLVCD